MASGPNVHSSFEKLYEDTLTRLTLVERRLAIQGGGGTGGSSVAAGMIQAWGSGSVPAGWLLADGAAVSRSQYAELFAAIGTTFGAGDGSTTFNLPNLKGRVPVGRDAGQAEFDVIGETGGAKTVSLTLSQMPRHAHTMDENQGGNVGYSEAGGGTRYTVGYGAARNNTGVATAYTGGDGSGSTAEDGLPHQNLQPYLVVNWIIATASGSGIQPTFIHNQGSEAQRNSTFGVPASAAEQAALANQSIEWFNTDRGWNESYFATTGTAGLTVRGLVTGVASGWYPIDGNGPRGIVYAAGSQAHSGAANFTNWTNFGTGASYRNVPASILEKTTANAAMQTFMGGRYQAVCQMDFPVGSGTGVIGFRMFDKTPGGTEVIRQSPVTLLAAYGQTINFFLGERVMFSSGYIYFRTESASWSIGLPNASYMELQYMGPALVSAA